MNNNIDTTCAPLFDTSLYPTGSTLAAMGSAYNILPFLCDLVHFATNPNVDPVLIPPPAYDWSPHLNFSVLTGVGDPRFSDGAILSACFTEFLPKIITQLEVSKAGGAKVIDSYVCGPDDIPILTRQNQPIQTTVGNGDINLYGYYIPPNPTGLMDKITEESIATFYANYLQNQKDIYSSAFTSYINTIYTPSACVNDAFSSNGWKATLVSVTVFHLFYVQLDYLVNGAVKSTVYLKYYPDSQQGVLDNLIHNKYIPSDSTVVVKTSTRVSNNAMIAMVLEPIPNYTKTFNNAKYAADQADKFSASVLDNYSNQYSTFTENPSAYLKGLSNS